MSSNGLKEVKNITEIYKTITPKSGYGHLQEVVDKRATIQVPAVPGKFTSLWATIWV